jgi:hypothetical protein
MTGFPNTEMVDFGAIPTKAPSSRADDRGPVLVTVEYCIRPQDREALSIEPKAQDTDRLAAALPEEWRHLVSGIACQHYLAEPPLMESAEWNV